MSRIVLSLIAAAILFAGWKLTSRSAYESATYSVLKTDDNVELREYPDLITATTEMGSRQGGDGSFGRLFGYISGGNDSKQKIAMTTPVFVDSNEAEASGTMSFVLPKGLDAQNVPEPSNTRVRITTRKGGLFAAIRFSGRDTDRVIAQQQSTLESWIQEHGYRVIGEPEFAGYDPPWTPSPLRRNEILIRVQEAE